MNPKMQNLSFSSSFTSESYFFADEHQKEFDALVVLFHGYGENAKLMLERCRDLKQNSRTALVSLEAPHPIYLPNGKTGSSWLCSYRREASIANDLEYVRSALAAYRQKMHWQKLVLVGYSQGAQMAMRVAHFIGADALITLGGEVPPELREPYASSSTEYPNPNISSTYSVALLRGKKDSGYPAEAFRRDALWYQSQGLLVFCIEIAGGHAWIEQSTTGILEAFEHSLKAGRQE